MSFSPPRIFISYARRDGRAAAEAFEGRLKAAGITAWRDIRDVVGGEDIRPQVLDAIGQAEHLVLILTGGALASDWVKREWSHARSVGCMVSPILADPSLKRGDLPDWIRRAEVYDLAEPERWAKLLQVLRGPGAPRRVPYMAGGPPPDGFVPRPAEYDALKRAILATDGSGTVALTTALRGAGGYGKTTLANALCRDEEVRFAFADGILRVEIGHERDDVTGLVVDLIERLDPKGRRPGYVTAAAAAEHLGALIGEARLLMVIDDVWREAQLQPFLIGGPRCVRLVTTRLPQVLPVGHTAIDVDAMRAAEAARLLSTGLPVADDPAAHRHLAALAKRLGGWALMLGIANGWLRLRIGLGEAPAAAVARFEERLDKRGLTAFDPKDEASRNRAIKACVEASLDGLDSADVARLGELAILPEDEAIPLDVVTALWAESGGLDEDEAEELAARFRACSLVQSLDLGARTLRLHDTMIWYLRNRIGPNGCRAAHAVLVGVFEAACGGDWPALPSADAYGGRFLIHHLRGAGQEAEANRLLADYGWIAAKLAVSGAQGLFADYCPEPEEPCTRLIGRALALSMQTLAINPRELPLQLYGRLGTVNHPIVAELVATACGSADLHLIPRWPGLTPPGLERFRLVGHEGTVSSAAFSPDGTCVVTASSDGTARLWETATGTQAATLIGHDGAVTSAAFSPDGTRIVTASDDNTARLWDAATGALTATLLSHDDAVTGAAFSPCGTRVVTASDDGTARLWDAATGALTVTFLGHDGGVTSAAFSPDGSRVVTVSDDLLARLRDAATGAQTATLIGHDGTEDSPAFSPDGPPIVIGSWDKTVRLWDAATGAQTTPLCGHDGTVTCAVFSPDGIRAVTASDDGTARLWDAATGAQIATLVGHDGGVTSAAFSPDGTRIVTVSWDKTARLWDPVTGTRAATLRGHTGSVTGAVFSPDGTRIVTASDDNTARLWDAATGAQIATFIGHDNSVKSAAFSPDGTRVITASSDGTARLWDAATDTRTATLIGHDERVSSAAFSPCGTRVVTASADKTARLWDIATGTQAATLIGHDGVVTSAAFSPDGSQIVTASHDDTVRLWDATTGTQTAALIGHDGTVSRVAYSPTGTRIVAASYWKDTVQLWDAATGTRTATLIGHNKWVIGAAFSPDGTRIVTVSWDNTARLWDAATGIQTATLVGHDSSVESAAFSPDGTRIVTASWDKTARLWAVATGAQTATLIGHDEPVNSAAFSPDGTRIVTASADKTARLWDIATGTQAATLIGHDGVVTSAAFSPDGTRIVTASWDKTARLWNAATGAEITRITLDATVTAFAVHGCLIALGDGLGRIHVLEAAAFLPKPEPSHG